MFVACVAKGVGYLVVAGWGLAGRHVDDRKWINAIFHLIRAQRLLCEREGANLAGDVQVDRLGELDLWVVSERVRNCERVRVCSGVCDDIRLERQVRTAGAG